ncbi:MAG: cobalt transporter CbiM [Ktedonobacteraceae bacterium]|nr:cobalt transporter CbiM [Ktedonobacteraceae bacterium]
MHIPDGYLGPAFSLGTGLVTVPAWAVASNRVRSVLNNRTVPLLAIFAAFAFTIMMFNVPVPGGTTAHAVGGTLIAIVLGPWAAVLDISVALIIQALFFGDGGILAIFANCLNMGVILPIVGYYSYRLISGKAPLLSTRRVWAAGIGAYLGITATALAVGIELGVQPLLFSQGGRPLYSPYPLSVAVPAMLVSHVFGASLVEGLVTALGIAYIQRHYPEYLTSLRSVVAGADIAEGERQRRSLWQIFVAGVALVMVVLFLAGLITGGGNVQHLFGVDWSQVSWPAVAVMLLVVAVLSIVLVPLAWFLLPRPVKKVGTAFVTAAILVPLGLIAPGFAFGEGSVEDVKQAFGYVPQGLQQFSGIFSAPLADYNIPLPFFSDANAPLWHAAVGYEISGVLGMLLLGGVVFALAKLIGRTGPGRGETTGMDDSGDAKGQGEQVVRQPTEETPGRMEYRSQLSWIEQTLTGVAAAIEQAVFTEEYARGDGWLQRLDPRAKIVMFLLTVLAASLSSSLPVLLAFYLVLLLVARASRVPFDFFVRRVWLGIPFFAGIVILPSIFFTTGERLFDIVLWSIHIGPSLVSIVSAAVFVMRVGVSVSLAVLLILTTPWAAVLKSLHTFHVPQIFTLLFSMTYRYIFLFLHAANGTFEARKSRTVGWTSGGEKRRWVGATMGNLVQRSFKMSNDVYAAMMARGFSGTVRTYHAYRMTVNDWLALAGAAGLAVGVFLLGGLL